MDRREGPEVQAEVGSRLQQIYWRLAEVAAARRQLGEEQDALLQEVAGIIGVRVGDVVAMRDGTQAKVLRARAEFMPLSDERGDACSREAPSVVCDCAPATRGGFHSRNLVRHRVVSPEVLTTDNDRLRALFKSRQAHVPNEQVREPA